MRHGLHRIRWCAAAIFAAGAVSHGAVLPDDRADVLWHSYDGGGITVHGPSVLMRKKVGDSLSLAANYYVDMISSASIDVVTQASPMCKKACYSEQRKQTSLSADYLHGKSIYSFGYINSNEPDYKARTGFFSISQDMFGDLTTVSFGYTGGWDKVLRAPKGVLDRTFSKDLQRRNWQLGLSQVLTRNLLLGLNFETSESEGYLNNPYRSVRYIDPSAALGYSWQEERYPATRTGSATSAQLKYYLPYRAAVDASYRFYDDTWGIVAHTLRVGYTQPVARNWTLEGSARFYRQTHADFYSDLFPYVDAQNFLARDRELAQFRSLTLGLGGTWEFHPTRWSWLTKGTLNLSWDRLHIVYDDFRDVRARNPSIAAGAEPLYVLDADVLQFFISVWY